MERNEITSGAEIVTGAFKSALVDFGLLVKFRLSLLVLFSAVMSYFIVAGAQFNWISVLLLSLGGFLVTGAANTLNQVLERDFDKQMLRTANRPLATGRMTVSTAVLLAGVMALFGISFLSVFNPLTGFLGTLSLISYAFIYTPMKRYSALAVWVGAIPGALPNIIGTVAFEHQISLYGLMLFAIQFLWQFPHFWAVAWLADEDYKKAGFSLLPSTSGEKDSSVGLISSIFCVALVLLSGAAWYIGLTGGIAAVILMGLNAYWAYSCLQLYKYCDRATARRQMFISFFHLPVTLIVLLLDKLF
jgi:protoheme IX farnesyltransferase